jgi:hypothetical protein
MNQQPDKLFREKLEGYQQQAPASAWDKLEAGLDKKSSRGMWLKVAASLLPVAVAAYLLLSTTQQKSDGNESHNIADKTVTPLLREKINKSSTDNNKTIVHSTDQETLIAKKEKENIKKVSTSAQGTMSAKDINTQVQSEKANVEEQKNVAVEKDQTVNAVAEVSVSATSLNSNEASSVVTTSSNKRKSITLVYTAEEVNEKFLDKNAVAEATPSEIKSSTLKTLLDKATDLTRDQDPVGELRQKKNEILALSFKKKSNVGKTDKTL